MPDPASPVDAAIRRALTDGATAYESRGIVVDARLESTHRLSTNEPVLDSALYTIFRGLPARLAPGAHLRIVTQDRAGGDIELSWEADEVVGALRDTHPFAAEAGPYGDLLELAVAGLETFCRARSGYVEAGEARLQQAPAVRRRYFFLIPTLHHGLSWIRD